MGPPTKEYIEQNTYNDFDRETLNEIRTINDNVEYLKEKRSRLKFYDDQDIRTVVLVCSIILIGIIYLVRPLVIFIVGIINEVR